MNYALTELMEQESWLRNYHSKMLQMVATKIAGNIKTLKTLKKNGYRIGKLRYLTDEVYNSFTYNQSGFRIKNDQIWLSKIGTIKIRLHRQPYHIKQVTVKREDGKKWYAIVCCEIAKPIFKFIDIAKKSAGIDVGITKFCHDSDNYAVENPLFLNKTLKPLRRASRQLSRRQKGSKNWKKAKYRLQILHERIRNQRNDFLHKLTHRYAERYDTIFLERLHTLNMVKNSHLSRHILDSGWGTFKQMLQYKSELVVEVRSNYTSVDCSRCGNKVPKGLAVGTHRCNLCGLVIDRDYNASLNIKKRGLQILLLPMERREVTPVEILGESVRQELPETIGLVRSSSLSALMEIS